jgi:Xaa-Pro dipeptidase
VKRLSHIEKRWKRARKLMAERGVDCLYTTAGTYQFYLAGWSAFAAGWPTWLYPFILPLEGDPAFILTPMSKTIMETSKYKSPVKDVRTYIEGHNDEALQLLTKTLEDLGVDKGVIGVQARMGFADYKLLKKAASDATIRDAQDLYYDLTVIKDEVEIGYLRKAAKIADLGFKLMNEMVRPGVSIYEVMLEIAKEKAKAGSERVGLGFGDADPTHVFKKGDIIDNESGGQVNRYGVDCARNIFVGEPTKRERKMYEATKAAYEAVEPLIRPGVTMHELDLACRKAMRDGLKDIIPNYIQPWKVGHGIGLFGNGHPAPLVVENNKLECAPGMAFTIDPGVFSEKFEPQRGYAAPIHIEKSVLVTEKGCEPLDKFHHELVIV